jgi:hypothetical protein
VRIFSGGMKHSDFVVIFDLPKLADLFVQLGHDKVMVYGEGYGGKVQGMSATYGTTMRFVAFDVQIGDSWLDVPNAADVAGKLGLEFVHYVKIDTSLASVDRERDADSVQAIRNGCGPGKMREGIVLRPLQELTRNNGHRLIVKHKRAEFSETKKGREIDPAKIEVLHAADAIAREWVTDMRLAHVIDKVIGSDPLDMKRTPEIIKAMIADVVKESGGEVIWSPEAYKAVSTRSAQLWKAKVMAVPEVK